MATLDESIIVPSLFLGMGLLCCAELALLIPVSFKQWSGVYFYGMITAAAGASILTVGIICAFLYGSHFKTWVPVAIVFTGNALFVCADFFVLYSRLHLVGTSSRTVKAIAIAVVLHLIMVEFPSSAIFSASAFTTNPKIQKAGPIFARIEGVCYNGLQVSFAALYFFQVRRTWSGDYMGLPRPVKHILIAVMLMACLDLVSLGLIVSEEFRIQFCFAVGLRSVQYQRSH
jgi:hypothetical protein